MGINRVQSIGPARLLTVWAAIGLIAAGLALGNSGVIPGLTFRDVVYSHHVKLTGVAVGTVNCIAQGRASKCAKITIHKGKKKVGTWTGAITGGCPHIGPACRPNWTGNGKMKIGTLKGKVKISVGCGFGKTSGTISKSSHNVVTGTEGISAKNSSCPPGPGAKKGQKFRFTLSY